MEMDSEPQPSASLLSPHTAEDTLTFSHTGVTQLSISAFDSEGRGLVYDCRNNEASQIALTGPWLCPQRRLIFYILCLRDAGRGGSVFGGGCGGKKNQHKKHGRFNLRQVVEMEN